jgi:glutamate-1-semialdehyde 2,1-aminomutase
VIVDPPTADTASRPREPSAVARDLQRRAHAAIPGGAHTYAKGDDQYPSIAPPVLVRGRGARVWDVDGNQFVEYGGGLRANVLGHAHPEVVDAVQRTAALGTNFVRPTALEVEAAEDLLDFIGRPSWMAKFTKNGSDADDAAVRLARAVTGRTRIAQCSDHPFYSVHDWFIGTTEMDAGIPREVADLTVGFRYGDLEDLERVLAAGDVAAVVMEAAKYEDPPEGYLAGVRAACDRWGAMFVLDEMVTGLRWPDRTAMQHYGAEPDLVTFGKALGNGFAVSALVGRAEHMRLGGLDHEHDRVFLLSYTHGAESTGLAAARAVMAACRRADLGTAMARAGERLRDALVPVLDAAGVHGPIGLVGPGQNMVFTTAGADGAPSQSFRALLMQELIRGGVIGPSLVNSTAHDDDDLERTVEAFAAAAVVYGRALEDGAAAHLVGAPTKPVFRRRN